MPRRRRWILLPLAALAAILIALVVLFDWNWLKGPLEGAVSAALEREFEVADLDVELAAEPVITLHQVRIANAPWGSRPDMLSIQQVRFAIELGPLLRGDLRLPFLNIEQPDLLLETNEEGLANWRLGEQDAPEPPPAIPSVGELEIVDAAIRYREPGRSQNVVAILAKVQGAATSTGVQLSASGTLNDEPLEVRLASAPLDRLEAEPKARRFPFELAARLGSTHLTATGSAAQLLEAQGLSVELVLESEKPGALLALAGREARDLDALHLSLALTRHDQIWALRNIHARLGGSDLRGDASFSNQGEVPAVAAVLRSDEVRLAEVRAVIAMLTGSPAPAAREPTLEATIAEAQTALEDAQGDDASASAPEADLSPDVLPAIEADVSYTIERLSGPDLLLRDVAFHGRLRDRLPYLALGGEGQYQDEPVTLALQVGDAAGDEEPYPIRANLAAAGTTIRADGALSRPEELAGLDLRFDVVSRDVSPLLALADLEAPPIPAFEAHGRLAQDGAAWQLTEFAGRLGESDIQGQATVELDRPEPLVTAELASDQVRIEDVRTLMPDAGREPGDAGFDLRRDLPAIDAEMSYTVARLSGPELALTDLDLHVRLEDKLPRLELTGGGQYQDRPVALDVQLGRTDRSTPGDGAYPIQARIEGAGTEIHLDGVIGEPETLDALDLQFQVESERITDLLALAGIDLPQIPPFLVTGHLGQDGQVWRVADLYAQFNESQLAGEATADLSGQRPFITADLQSKRLLLDELVSAGEQPAVIEAAGAAATPSTEATEQAALISLQGLNFDALPDLDADVSFAGEFVELQDIRFDQLSFDLKLRDQVAVLDASGAGRYRDGPLTFEAQLGTEQSIEDPEARYPIDVQIASEETQVTVEGTSAEPGRLEGLQVNVALRGPDLDRAGEILQLPLPTTPPFELKSRLEHRENRWMLTDLNGTVGDSDVHGQATLVIGEGRPMLEAELTSNALDLDDVGLVVGVPPDPEETVSVEQAQAAAEQAVRESVLPDEPFDVPELRAMDARLSYRAQQVQAQKLPLAGMALDLTLQDGQLTLAPLRFDVADGQVESTIRFDGRGDTLTGELELTADGIQLNQLLSRFNIEVAEIEVEEGGTGTFRGKAHLAVRGNSLAELAGSANGQVALMMWGGRINEVIVALIGLDIGEALAVLLSPDRVEQAEMMPIRCFVSDFKVQDGVMRAEALVLDTRDSTVTGRGEIDLGAETLSLELVGNPKDPGAPVAATPVRIEGTFKEPQIDVLTPELQEKALAALGLGVILPLIGAVLPFVEAGTAEDEDCGRLLEAAAASVQEAAPAPQ